jgi:hypothetical protein
MGSIRTSCSVLEQPEHRRRTTAARLSKKGILTDLIVFDSPDRSMKVVELYPMNHGEEKVAGFYTCNNGRARVMLA